MLTSCECFGNKVSWRPAQAGTVELLEGWCGDHRGRQLDFSPTEFRLLGVLAKSAGQVLSQEQLLEHVWGHAYAESLDVVRVYIGYLRRKIELDPKQPRLIETVRGFGYRYRKPQP
tara:strand:+ start:1195 stop:1542 length:348 start_codon:yes stop_codon:yes gene_type:complete